MVASGSPTARPITVGLALTLLLTLVVHGLSKVGLGHWGQDAVTVVLVAATYWLVLNKSTQVIRHFGLGLGGVLEPVPLDSSYLVKQSLGALKWALLCSLVVLPPYALGYVWWWQPSQAFELRFADTWGQAFTEVLGQWLMVGLPEEMFYRGYLQTALDDRFPARVKVLGARLGPGVLIASAIFAVGHYLTVPFPARLSVFFPALLFGWLRCRTGGIGAAALFHAFCNLFALVLGKSYGIIP